MIAVRQSLFPGEPGAILVRRLLSDIMLRRPLELEHVEPVAIVSGMPAEPAGGGVIMPASRSTKVGFSS